MLPEAERMTRAQIVASFVVLCYVWVFLGAVALQNQQRTPAPAAQAQPSVTATVGRTVSIYVTHDNHVYTQDNGEVLMHVPLMTCPQQVIAVEVSEHGPFVTMAERPAQGFRAAYSLWVDQPYVVISSRTGIQLLFDDGEHVRLDALCHRSSTAHFMGVFVREGMVYLADMSLGTSVPLFHLEPHCRLVWRDAEHETSAYLHEMSLPLSGIGNPLAEDARLAFTFQTTGAPQLHVSDAFDFHVIASSGVVQLSSQCDQQP